MCPPSVYDALARTAQLLRMDVFHSDPAVDHLIVDGLRASTVRIVADRANLKSYSGQTALVTTHNLIAMLGMQIDLDIPDVGLVGPQPPLRGDRLDTALRDYSGDLIPGGASNPSADPDLTLAIGSTPAKGANFRVGGDAYRAHVVPAEFELGPWRDADAVGALAAAAAAAAEAARIAIPRIQTLLGPQIELPAQWLPDPGRHVNLDLRRVGQLRPHTDLRDVDIVSGGAITNAALYTLLRLDVRADRLRVIEPDTLDMTNLNRYALARRSNVDTPKIDVLEPLATAELPIVGTSARLDDWSASGLRPFAGRVVVGVDDIPSRWLTQREAKNSTTIVGASSHDFAIASVHRPHTPCAGCAHPKNDPFDGTIPTISFVSFWAGLVTAMLLASAGDAGDASVGVRISPLGLHNRFGLDMFEQAASADCPVHCPASNSAFGSRRA